MSFVQRLKIEAEDTLRYHPAVRSLLCEVELLKDRTPPAADPQAIARSIVRLCAAARLAESQPQLLKVEARIAERMQLLDRRPVDLAEFGPSSSLEMPGVDYFVPLKPYVSEREKGVCYIAFEHRWARLVHQYRAQLEAFAKRYLLIVHPVWATPHGLINYYLPAIWPGDDPVFACVSDPHDLETLPRQSPRYVVIPRYCSHWVNPAVYPQVPFAQKNIDIVMLANFGKYKRHFALFKALREMPRTVKVVCIGQHNDQRTREVLLAEAAAYGVADRFELKENAPDTVVFDCMARAKVNLILSKREGSCIALVEAMFANTPSGMLQDAEVGSRVFINEHTGRFLSDDNLGAQLMDFIADAGKFAPRQWMLEQKHDCHGSSAVMNEVIKRTMLARGQDWTTDLCPLHWRPVPQFLRPEDRGPMQATYEDIRNHIGIQMERRTTKRDGQVRHGGRN
jgi:glycosyltransferase involved in cell wall biosynthesis